MLNIGTNRAQLCSGVSRREFLRVGALGMGGLSLPQLLQAEAQAGITNSNKAINHDLFGRGSSSSGHV